MEQRRTNEHPEAEGRVPLPHDPLPALAADWRAGPQRAWRPGRWRRWRALLWPMAFHLTLLLLFATGMAAQTMIFARTDGLAEAFAGLMDYLSFVGGLVTGGGLVWAGLFLRDRAQDWPPFEILGGVAAAAAGIALIAATQAISDLSGSGAIPIP